MPIPAGTLDLGDVCDDCGWARGHHDARCRRRLARTHAQEPPAAQPAWRPDDTPGDAADLLAQQLAESELPPAVRELELLGPEREHVACGGTGRLQTVRGERRCGACGGTGRRRERWRADFAWRAERLVVEVDGGVHTIRANWRRDVQKRQWLAIEGWAVLPVLADQVRRAEAVAVIAAWFERRQEHRDDA